MTEEVRNIEMTIAQAEAKISKMEKWEELLKNPLFDELITKDYLGDDAVRLTLQLKPGKEDSNEIVNTMLVAKALLSRFVGRAIDEGVQSISALEEHKDLLNEVNEG